MGSKQKLCYQNNFSSIQAHIRSFVYKHAVAYKHTEDQYNWHCMKRHHTVHVLTQNANKNTNNCVSFIELLSHSLQ